MSPRTRSRIVGLLVLVVAIVALREYSIRRHTIDLEAWPGREDDDPSVG